MMTLQSSIEITPLRPGLVKSLSVPGSKSHSNRAMLLAALADGKSTLRDILIADDTRTMAVALAALGFEIDFNEEEKSCSVLGLGGKFPNNNASLTADDAGTVMRFLSAALASSNGRYTMSGSERMCERPIADLVDSLRSLGVEINYLQDEGCPPIEIISNGLSGGEVLINANTSSQFVSAMLMAAPYAHDALTINLGENVVSRPFIDLTSSIMMTWGVEVEATPEELRVASGQKYKSGDYQIEGDATAASYFWGIAAITKSAIKVSNVGTASSQGDVAFVDILEEMGCEVTKTPRSITVRGTGNLKGGRFDLDKIPDTAQTLAVVSLFASSPTEIINVHNLRQKECDRLSALATELPKLGAEVIERADSLLIIPPEGGVDALRGAEIATYKDHRMAMSFAVAGCVIPHVVINNPACVSKTFPDFFDVLAELSR